MPTSKDEKGTDADFGKGYGGIRTVYVVISSEFPPNTEALGHAAILLETHKRKEYRNIFI